MRAQSLALAAAIALSALTLTACATEGTSMPSPGDTASSSRPPFQTASPAPLTPTGSAADLPAAKWDALIADLAARGVTGEPAVISSERVDFSDGSLGCPAPGMSYTQAIVEGYRVVVRADDRVFDYRFGNGDNPRLCER